MEIRSGKSEHTQREYLRVSQMLGRKFTIEMEYDESENEWRRYPQEFCKWFINKVKSKCWSKRTYWKYRASLEFFFETHGPIECVAIIKTTNSIELPSKGIGTSSKKLKRLPPKIMDTLKLALGKGRGPYDHIVLAWLDAGLYSGLRPVEWEKAYWDNAHNTLVVKNAKRDTLRGNGEERHILYDPILHGTEIAAIKKFISLRDNKVRTGTPFSLMYLRCRNRLYYACSQLFPKLEEKPSLYSTRHQFAANMKASGLTKAQVAAIMGHSSDATATCHYARKTSGMKIKPPSSPPNEVATVKAKDGNFKPSSKHK